jgi:methylase of polypeptide subunit release factors
MPSELALRLLGAPDQGWARRTIGGALTLLNRITGRTHYDRLHLERVHGTPILILPTVFNPRVLRSGAFFAAVIAARRLGEGGRVLDLGTGSGICAVFAARHASSVVAVDINRAAVRCAGINASINGLAERIECRHGDLFAPVAGERFDAICFNPPFYVGAPASERDAAWRSLDLVQRFCGALDAHLLPRGRAYLLLSTSGDACPRFVEELARRGHGLSVLATRRFINERVTIVAVNRAGE